MSRPARHDRNVAINVPSVARHSLLPLMVGQTNSARRELVGQIIPVRRELVGRIIPVCPSIPSAGTFLSPPRLAFEVGYILACPCLLLSPQHSVLSTHPAPHLSHGSPYRLIVNIFNTITSRPVVPARRCDRPRGIARPVAPRAAPGATEAKRMPSPAPARSYTRRPARSPRQRTLRRRRGRPPVARNPTAAHTWTNVYATRKSYLRRTHFPASPCLRVLFNGLAVSSYDVRIRSTGGIVSGKSGILRRAASPRRAWTCD